jgi:predicted metal-dependent hydrolase
MDERLYVGLEDFNKENFYEAHEILEEFWHEYRGIDRTFIQGLIQLAAAFYHAQSFNRKGAMSQITKGSLKLTHYQPTHNSVDVTGLLESVKENLQQLREHQDLTTTRIVYPKISYTKVSQTSNQGS